MDTPYNMPPAKAKAAASSIAYRQLNLHRVEQTSWNSIH